jgi:hypothetical protein
MSEVRKWLETVGLAQYADAFEANARAASKLAGCEREKPSQHLLPPLLVGQTGCLRCGSTPRNDAHRCGATCRAAS